MPEVTEALRCADCSAERRFGSSLCDDCEVAASTLEECDHCGSRVEQLFHNERLEASLCESCDLAHPMFECQSCGTEYRDADDADECCRYRCDNCRSSWEDEHDAYACCRHQCSECDEWHDDQYDAQDCCQGSREFYGHLPDLPDIDPYRVTVPEIEGRPARLCSIEQELASGGAMVAALLHRIGLSEMSYVTDYHYGGTGRSTAHVEEDGSLPSGGGEVVFDRFNLSDEASSRRLSEALAKIRQLRDEPGRPVTTSYAAGVHVHISARAEDGTTLTPRDVAALYELWSYAEDMLYSFSACGWSRHRQPCDEYSDSGYCKPVPKAPGKNTPRKVWNLMRRDRYYGLNFQRIFESASRCSCGAATMGDWESCDCGAFDKATVEWRVFNSSTLPRTIHAWLIMAHAMTAYAAKLELGTLTANPYGSQDRIEKNQVLEYLLEVLPLAEGERAVIREAAGRSPGL